MSNLKLMTIMLRFLTSILCIAFIFEDPVNFLVVAGILCLITILEFIQMKYKED